MSLSRGGELPPESLNPDLPVVPVEPATAASVVTPSGPPAPGGRSEIERVHAEGALPAVPGAPPVSTAIPVPAARAGLTLPGVQLGQRARRRGDTFGWPANAAPGKPEGEVDTRP
jgi:hypothetical protein